MGGGGEKVLFNTPLWAFVTCSKRRRAAQFEVVPREYFMPGNYGWEAFNGGVRGTQNSRNSDAPPLFGYAPSGTFRCAHRPGQLARGSTRKPGPKVLGLWKIDEHNSPIPVGH